MKKKHLIIIIVTVIFLLCSYIAWLGLSAKRDFVILYNTKLNFCFMVDNRYKLEISDESFKYRGGKNSGHIQLIKAGLSSDIVKVEMNGFKAGYKKVKNIRYYEFKLNDDYILRDSYQNLEKTIVNLVPYGIECSKIKQNFKKHLEIFGRIK
jgi:hypothetical protein